MLRLLRADDAQDSPNPTAADIPALVDRFRRAGLTVEPAEVDLGSEPLGAAVDLSVYRVVQEALTNSLKHAGRRSAPRCTSSTVMTGSRSRSPARGRHSGPFHRTDIRRRPGPDRHARAGRDVRRHPARRSRPGRLVRDPGAHPAGVHMTSVVIADDEALVREGLSALLGRRGIDVLDVAADGRAAIDGGRRAPPRRRADGHPDAGHGRDRGHRRDRRTRPSPGTHPHDLPPGRVRRSAPCARGPRGSS